MTIETTYSRAREQLKLLMDRAVDDREVIVVRRRNGSDVAMIAAEDSRVWWKPRTCCALRRTQSGYFQRYRVHAQETLRPRPWTT